MNLILQERKQSQNPTDNYEDVFGLKSYLNRGLYLRQLKLYLAYFNPQDIFVINFEDIKTSMTDISQEIFHFLGLDPTDKLREEILNDSTKRTQTVDVPQEAIDRLVEFYTPHNQAFFDYLDMDLGWKRKIKTYPKE